MILVIVLALLMDRTENFKMTLRRWLREKGAFDLTRSSLNTTHRVYFYVIVKMWFTLPINEGCMVFTDRLIAMGARIERLSK